MTNRGRLTDEATPAHLFVRMGDIFRWRRRVEFHETDAAGIVHFSVFLRWMEAAEHAFLADRKVPLHGEVKGVGTVGWPRVNCRVDFRAPVRFGDEVEVTVRLAELGRRSVRYAFEVRGPDGEMTAEGEMTSVCARLQPEGEMEVVAIPAEIRESLSV